MAKSWISTPKFYRQLHKIAGKLSMPTMSLSEQADLYSGIVRSSAHSDFMDSMVEYIDMLESPEDERYEPNEIRISHGEWFGLANDAKIFMACHLADRLKASNILSDTYFIQRKTITSMSLNRQSDGSIEVVIQNEQDQWPIRRTFNPKQRFLLIRFLQSITRRFNQVEQNLASDAGKRYTFEADTLLTQLFESGQDAQLIDAVIGRSYYTLKYFVGVEDGQKKFYTHRTLSGDVATLKSDFFESVEKGFSPKFAPDDFPRLTVPACISSGYTRKQKRLPTGTLNIHMHDNVGIIEIRDKGAKSSESFPFCAAILPTGQLLMRRRFQDEAMIAAVLNG